MGKRYFLDRADRAVLYPFLAAQARGAACPNCAALLRTASVVLTSQRLSYALVTLTVTCPDCRLTRSLEIELTTELVAEAQRTVTERRQRPIDTDELIEVHELLTSWEKHPERPLSELVS